jgi:dephospho-CoA kinase
MKRAVRVGVTGKLGSGKSTLMHALAQQGIRVLNTDDLAKNLMVRETNLRSAIEELAGTDVYQDGELDRKLLASKLFKDSDLREKLEAIVHPAVTQEVEREFADAPAESIVAVESALILSSNFRKFFDYIILVDAPNETVLERVRQYSAISEEDAKRRLSVQDYEHANYEEVDITIENSGTQEEFFGRALTLAQMLKVLAHREMPAEPLHADEDDQA